MYSIAILGCAFFMISCSAKKDNFLAARDGIAFTLPSQGISQQPLYPAPSLNRTFSANEFISRPRPQPGFIGNPPSDYAQELSRQIADRIQSLRLGYSSRAESSLHIRPYLPADQRALLRALSQRGFKQQEEYILTRQEGPETLIATLYFYPAAVLLSLEQSSNSQAEFRLLDEIRRSFQLL